MVKAYSCGSSFAAVCVTCYQADKSPVETTVVSDNNIMSTDEIKELISEGAANEILIQKTLLKPIEPQFQKHQKDKKTSKIKTGTKKNSSTGSSANGGTAGVVQEAQSHQLQKFLPVDMQMVPIQAPEPVSEERSLFR